MLLLLSGVGIIVVVVVIIVVVVNVDIFDFFNIGYKVVNNIIVRFDVFGIIRDNMLFSKKIIGIKI